MEVINETLEEIIRLMIDCEEKKSIKIYRKCTLHVKVKSLQGTGRLLPSIAGGIIITHHRRIHHRPLGGTTSIRINHGCSRGTWWNVREQHTISIWRIWCKWDRAWDGKPRRLHRTILMSGYRTWSKSAIISPFFPLFLPIPTISAPSGRSDTLLPLPLPFLLPFRSPRSFPRSLWLVSRTMDPFWCFPICILYFPSTVSFSARY